MTKFSFKTTRSTTYARNGMVATSQPLAAQAGLDVLKQGGNAIDAALATVAALCVTEPCMTGIGGDAFAIIYSAKDKKLYGINGSGPAGAGISAEKVRAAGHDEMPFVGGLTVTVPGSLRAWEMAANKFGSLPLDKVMAQAIDYAENGFAFSPIIADVWGASYEKMTKHADSARVWFPDDKKPKAGDIFKNPELAATLKKIASEGVDVFYNGTIAEQIVKTVQADGGFLTLEDLANFEAEWVDPISAEITTNGHTYSLHEIPPNGQGLTALIALNMVSDIDWGEIEWGSAEYVHTLAEATKFAFADAAAYIADPKHCPIPLEGLLSKAYARERFAQITPQAQQPTAGDPWAHCDTVYLTTADAEGNMVSWIQSNYAGFGSGLTAGDTGIHLQNRGANFVLDEGHPNQIVSGKRPYHTIIPAFIMRDGAPWCSYGVMGGFMQPQGHLQVLLNMCAYGMDPQTALDAPRYQWMKGMELALEPDYIASIGDDLQAKGHVQPEKQPAYGGGQVIIRDPETGVLAGGTEPRKDGQAVGW